MWNYVNLNEDAIKQHQSLKFPCKLLRENKDQHYESEIRVPEIKNRYWEGIISKYDQPYFQSENNNYFQATLG